MFRDEAAKHVAAAAGRERKDDPGQRAGLRQRARHKRERGASGKQGSAINHRHPHRHRHHRRRVAVEHQPLDHGGLAEFLAHLVDRVLGLARRARPCGRRGRRRRPCRRRSGSRRRCRSGGICVPSISRASRSRPASKMRAASCVGSPSERARVRMRKSAVFSFSVTVEPAMPLAFRRARHPLGQRPEHLLQRLVARDVLVERRLGRHALGLALRIDAAVVDAARQPPQPAPLDAVAAHQVGLVRALQVRDGVVAVALQPRLRSPCRRPR